MIEDLFRHHVWANTRLLEACENLSDEQLDARIPGTYGSIRDTLGHVLRAEISYVERVTGQTPSEQFKEGEFPDFEMLKSALKWTGQEFLQLARGVKEGDLVSETDGKVIVEYRLSSLLTQSINHATEHRSQIATILTQQGIEPPNMDVWTYMEENGQFIERNVESSA